MSYILDALNKSEQERREQQRPPNLNAIHQPQATASTQKLWWMGAVIALAIAVASGAYMWLTVSAVNSPNRLSNFEEEISAPQNSPSAVSTIEPRTQAPAATPLKQVPAATPLKQVPTATSAPVDGQRKATAATGPSSPNRTEVESLYTEPKRDTVSRSASPALPPDITQHVRAALQRQSETLSIDALPFETQAKLPTMYYSAHIFSNEEGKGFAIINDRARYKGDVLGPGLFVQEVREGGVILNLDGQSFLLDALTDWPPE